MRTAQCFNRSHGDHGRRGSDFEEQLCEPKPGQTFRLPSQSSEETHLTRSPVSPDSPGSSGKRTDFIFLPASKQLYDDETSSSVFGLRSVINASPCGPERPPQAWSSHCSSKPPPPVAEKPRWSQGRRTPAERLPLDITGETGGGGGGGGGKFHGVDLLQHSPCPSPADLPREPRPSPADLPREPRSLEPVSDTLHQGAPLRKTHSDLETALSPDPGPARPLSDLSPGAMDHTGLLCSWNGPRGSTFAPGTWNHLYPPTKGPAVPPKQHTVVGGCIQALPPVTQRSETEGSEASRGRQRSARSIAAANAFKFRERSLSTPTDADCFGFGNEQRLNVLGESYALLYPSGSSEDSASTADTVSIAASDQSHDSRLRLRSRSISLKKSKRKPPPPVRSVSLMKSVCDADGAVRHGRGLYRDGRPKSLHIPREHDYTPDFLLPPGRGGGRGGDRPPSLEIQAPDQQGETELNHHWQLGEWKNSSDPYRSLSGSSTATGTTVLECARARGSSESLPESPSTSRAASPSPATMETDHNKGSSPFRPPHGLMSPSSGYSSQSEAPTPTAVITATGCKLRPKIPERKSSLPSPKDPAARSRLSFEMPGNAHLELSALKPKQKANRRHSDTSTAEKPGKVSPAVTANELKTVRLRSVSRGDLEDCPDGASDTIEEEHGRDNNVNHSPPPTLPKPRPPVAVKPPLPKRPINLPLKSPTVNESPPPSPIERPVPLGNIYKVMKKPKPKKTPPQVQTSPDLNQNQNHDTGFTSASLFELPPLPDPQPLLEDPTGPEPISEPVPEQDLGSGPELRLGDGGSLPGPCSSQDPPEVQDKSRTLPLRNSCGAETDKKKPKVPPPVPKKPRCVKPTSTFSNGSSTQPHGPSLSPLTAPSLSPLGAPSLSPSLSPLTAPSLSPDRPSTPQVPETVPEEPENLSPETTDLQHLWENHTEHTPRPEEHTPRPEEPQEEQQEEPQEEPQEAPQEDSSKEWSLQDSSLSELEHKMATVDMGTDGVAVIESRGNSELQIPEETEDVLSCSTHTTEDLFTIIHRSKRKVLGRKEPSDSFGSRQNLSSPVKSASCGSELRSYTLSSAHRSSSRNENFMALLQKKSNKTSSCGTRVSAAELLKSTNPLARRVTDYAAANTNDDATSATSNCSQ